jgi:hypothetical protein
MCATCRFRSQRCSPPLPPQFLKAKFGGTVPEAHLAELDYALLANVNRDLTEYLEAMEAAKVSVCVWARRLGSRRTYKPR